MVTESLGTKPFTSVYEFYTNRISFHQINPVLRQETCVLIGYDLLYMKSTNRLMMTTKKSGVFVDVSKALEKVWQVDLLYELKQNSIEDNLVKTWTDFSSSRKQELLWAVSIQHGLMESLGFLKGRYLDFS